MNTETERDTAKSAGAETKVCILMHFLCIQYTYIILMHLMGSCCLFYKRELVECQSQLENEKKRHKLTSDNLKAKSVGVL